MFLKRLKVYSICIYWLYDITNIFPILTKSDSFSGRCLRASLLISEFGDPNKRLKGEQEHIYRPGNDRYLEIQRLKGLYTPRRAWSSPYFRIIITNIITIILTILFTMCSGPGMVLRLTGHQSFHWRSQITPQRVISPCSRKVTEAWRGEEIHQRSHCRCQAGRHSNKVYLALKHVRPWSQDPIKTRHQASLKVRVRNEHLRWSHWEGSDVHISVSCWIKRPGFFYFSWKISPWF